MKSSCNCSWCEIFHTYICTFLPKRKKRKFSCMFGKNIRKKINWFFLNYVYVENSFNLFFYIHNLSTYIKKMATKKIENWKKNEKFIFLSKEKKENLIKKENSNYIFFRRKLFMKWLKVWDNGMRCGFVHMSVIGWLAIFWTFKAKFLNKRMLFRNSGL